MRWLERLIGREIAQGALLGSGLMAARVLLQAIYLVMTARALSVAGYGQFAAVVSLVAIVAPLAGLGSGMVMLKEVAREPARLASSWAATLRLTIYSGLVFAALLIPFSIAVLPGVEWRLAAAVVAAEVLATPLIVAAALAFQALGHFGAAHAVSLVLYAVRLAAAGLMLFWLAEPTPAAFAGAHLAATAIGAAAALILVQWRLRPRLASRAARASWREGLPYAASGVIGLVNNELDKPLLLRLAGADAAGAFAAAFRLASAVTAPVGALMLAAAPVLFREAGAPPTRALRVLAVALGYSLIAAVCVVGFAWLAPVLLGQTFAASVALLQWLAPWLVCNAARHIGNTALTTRGHQNVRLALEGAAAAASAVLNVVRIPTLGALGAVCALTLTDAMIGILAWLFLLVRRRNGILERP